MEFTVTKNRPETEVTLTEETLREGILLLKVDLRAEQAVVPEPLTVRWKIDCTDIYSTWSPMTGFRRVLAPDWGKKVTRSRFASGSPVHALLSREGKNRMTVAVSDAQTPLEIATGVCEETAQIEWKLTFFTGRMNKINGYRATVYIDTREVGYITALKDADRFLSKDCGYPSAYIPEAARLPMYSCWYSFHQDLDPDEIVRQCRLAKDLGMDSVIVDDGWQTDHLERGYAYCGDWEVCPGKIPDMKGFVDRVHECGMKLILWYSVPFIGIHSKAYERFSDRFLDNGRDIPKRGRAVLDPRYPEVREYLIDIYRRAQKEWGIDGFKLDFIDSFQIVPETKEFDPRWDTLSLEDGIDKLLGGITDALRKGDPNVLIEFRQTYFGPAIRKYGNMIRVGDCPDDPMLNHVNVTDLRFCTDRTAIHSDMLMWHPKDSAVSVARQLICVLFAVPQISVLLDRIPKEQLRVLRFWLNYWRENRKVLLEGEFSAKAPEFLYSQVWAESLAKTVAVAHTDPLFAWGGSGALDLINATGGETLVIQTEQALGVREYRILDCTGKTVEKSEQDFSAGLHGFRVPECGMISIG